MASLDWHDLSITFCTVLMCFMRACAVSMCLEHALQLMPTALCSGKRNERECVSMGVPAVRHLGSPRLSRASLILIEAEGKKERLKAEGCTPIIPPAGLRPPQLSLTG